MGNAGPRSPWNMELPRLIHDSGLALVFHSAEEFEIERIPPKMSTRTLRELVREAEQVYAERKAHSAPATSSTAPIPSTGRRASRLSLRKKTEPA